MSTALVPRAASADAMQDGDVAAKQGKWEDALAAYRKADAAAPSAKTKLRVADALYELGRVGEAHDAYVEVIANYRTKLFLLDLRKAEQRRDELAAKLGTLELRVSEVGATIAIDGTVVGTSPVSTPIRLAAGEHELTISKQGFAKVTRTVTIEAQKKASLEVRLEPVVASGKVTVTSSAGPMTVLIDGEEVGTTPFEGELTPGEHQIQGLLDGVKTAVTTVTIEDGAAAEITLEPATEGRLEVRVEGGSGTIYIDGEKVGAGSFEGALAAGTHTLRVEEEGYEPYEAEVEVVAGDLRAETVTLRKKAAGQIEPPETPGESTDDPEHDGLYGGVQLAGAFLPAGAGSAFDDDCRTVGATRCSAGTTLGGALGLYIGYAFDPIGLELYARGSGDITEPTASFDGITGSDINPLLASPAREESFTVGRVGGGGAIRLRLLFPFEPLRVTTAIGGGLAYRQFLFARDTVAADGATGSVAPDVDGYLSGVLSVEVAAQLSVSESVALALGLDLWLEHAGDGVDSAPERESFLTGGSSGLPAPQATPAYGLATSTQLYLGPFLGLQFGP